MKFRSSGGKEIKELEEERGATNGFSFLFFPFQRRRGHRGPYDGVMQAECVRAPYVQHERRPDPAAACMQ